MFGELSRQSNTFTLVPPEARELQIDLLLPLIDGEKADQHEVELQMQPFVSKAQQTIMSTLEKKIVEKAEDIMSKSTEEDMDVLIKGIVKIDFENPRLKKKVLQRAFGIWLNFQSTRTRAMKRKRSEFSSLSLEFEAAMEQE